MWFLESIASVSAEATNLLPKYNFIFWTREREAAKE